MPIAWSEALYAKRRDPTIKIPLDLLTCFAYFFSMRTTLDLPDPLFKEVKTRAVQQGVKLKQLLTTYIEAGLRASQTPEIGTGACKNPYPLPVAWERAASDSATPQRTNAELYAMLDAEDVENFHRISRQP